jgi:hypothetical protein
MSIFYCFCCYYANLYVAYSIICSVLLLIFLLISRCTSSIFYWNSCFVWSFIWSMREFISALFYASACAAMSLFCSFSVSACMFNSPSIFLRFSFVSSICFYHLFLLFYSWIVCVISSFIAFLVSSFVFSRSFCSSSYWIWSYLWVLVV